MHISPRFLSSHNTPLSISLPYSAPSSYSLQALHCHVVCSEFCRNNDNYCPLVHEGYHNIHVLSHYCHLELCSLLCHNYGTHLISHVDNNLLSMTRADFAKTRLKSTSSQARIKMMAVQPTAMVLYHAQPFNRESHDGARPAGRTPHCTPKPIPSVEKFALHSTTIASA